MPFGRTKFAKIPVFTLLIREISHLESSSHQTAPSARLLHFLALSVVVKPTKRGSLSLYNFLMHRGISGNLNHLRCA
jgi:hypothetical protein